MFDQSFFTCVGFLVFCPPFPSFCRPGLSVRQPIKTRSTAARQMHRPPHDTDDKHSRASARSARATARRAAAGQLKRRAEQPEGPAGKGGVSSRSKLAKMQQQQQQQQEEPRSHKTWSFRILGAACSSSDGTFTIQGKKARS